LGKLASSASIVVRTSFKAKETTVSTFVVSIESARASLDVSVCGGDGVAWDVSDYFEVSVGLLMCQEIIAA
jgi:hypothetical protein